MCDLRLPFINGIQEFHEFTAHAGLAATPPARLLTEALLLRASAV